jgi:CubicO group peptidase (beta-lactamase class C family)
MLFLPLVSFCQTAENEQKKYHELELEIVKVLQKTKVIGISIAIINNYEVAWVRGFGLKEVNTNDSITTETLFQAASITKSIIAMTVMKEFQNGRLDIDEDVNNYLEKWKMPKGNSNRNSFITLKQLLSHTGGVSNMVFPVYRTDEKIPTVTEALNGKAPAKNGPLTVINAPGQFSYSSAGYAVIHQVLEDIEKQGLESIVAEKLFTPLDMNLSTFSDHLPNGKFESIASGHLDDNKVIEGKYFILRPLSFGSLWTTPRDLAKFLVEMQLSLEERSNKVLNKENAGLMLNPTGTWKGNYGLGFSKEVRGTGVNFFGHDGHNYGYICSMIGSIKGGFGLVIMTNSENGWKAVNQIKKLVGRKFWGF